MVLVFEATDSNVMDFSKVFSNLAPSELSKIESYLVQQTYPARIPVCAEGSKGDGLFLINSGEVEVIKKIPGGRKEIKVLGKGDVFGEISFLNHCAFTATVVTKSECEITCFKRTDFEEIEKKDIKLAYKIALSLAKILSEKLLSSNERLK